MLAGGGQAPDGDGVKALGPVRDDRLLADAYRAADVYAVPTTADVLTKTAPEAIATGTPCVAFDRGGVTDVVRHYESGYQARFGDVHDLRNGLALLLGDDGLRSRLGRGGRELAEREFSTEVQVDRYLTLYEDALAS